MSHQKQVQHEQQQQGGAGRGARPSPQAQFRAPAGATAAAANRGAAMMGMMAANVPSAYILIPEDYDRLSVEERFKIWDDLPYNPTKLTCCLPCLCCTPTTYLGSSMKAKMRLMFPPATATPLERTVVKMRKQGVVVMPILMTGGLKDNESGVGKCISCTQNNFSGMIEPVSMRHPLQIKFDHRLASVGLDQMTYDRFLDEKLKLFESEVGGLRWANNAAAVALCCGNVPYFWPIFASCHTCSLCYHGGVKNNGLWGIPIPLEILFCCGDCGFDAKVYKKASGLTESWKQELQTKYPGTQFDFVWTESHGETPLDILARYRDLSLTKADPSDWLGYAYNESRILLMIAKSDKFDAPEDPLSWALGAGGDHHTTMQAPQSDDMSRGHQGNNNLVVAATVVHDPSSINEKEVYRRFIRDNVIGGETQTAAESLLTAGVNGELIVVMDGSAFEEMGVASAMNRAKIAAWAKKGLFDDA